MTAHASRTDRKLCLNAGMNDYISKPFDGNDLFATIRKNIETLELKAPQNNTECHFDPEMNHDIKHLDIEEGSRRVGSTESYIAILEEFCKDQQYFKSTFQKLIVEKSFQAAKIEAQALPKRVHHQCNIRKAIRQIQSNRFA